MTDTTPPPISMAAPLAPAHRGPARLLARIRQAGAAVAASLLARTALTAGLAAGALTFNDFGAYLDEAMFLKPAMLLKNAMGMQPVLDPRVRVIMADDRTLKTLGRQPRFDEWYAVARGLLDLGYQTVLLQEPLDVLPDGAAAQAPATTGFFAVAAVDTAGAKSSRSITPEELSGDLFSSDWQPRRLAALPRLVRLIVPAELNRHVIQRLGHVNIASDHAVPMALVTTDGHVLPHLGLLAAGPVDVRDGTPFVAGRPLPEPANGRVLIDYVTLRSMAAQSLPIHNLYAADGTRPEFSDAIRQKLAGGTIAVLIPSAFTGSRYLTSHAEGQVPAYMALLSVMTSALRGHLIHQPWSDLALILTLLPVLILVAARAPAPWALYGLPAGAVAVAAAGPALLHGAAIYLPCTQIILLAAAAWCCRAAHEYVWSMRDRLRYAQELEFGQTVQRLVLPGEMQGTFSDWSYRIVYQPYGALSGDWAQVKIDGTSGRAVFAIGDVVGKGTGAALTAATISGVWSHIMHPEAGALPDPGTVVLRLNAALKHSYRGFQNTTISVASLDGSRVTLTSCAAPHWFQIRGGSIIPHRCRPAHTLGTMPDSATVHTVTVDTEPEDIFIAFTDGVVEGVGVKKLRDALAKMDFRSMPLAGIFGEVQTVAEKIRGQYALPDDFTLLILVRRAAAEGELTPPAATPAAA